jgi:hypothetical protein
VHSAEEQGHRVAPGQIKPIRNDRVEVHGAEEARLGRGEREAAVLLR